MAAVRWLLVIGVIASSARADTDILADAGIGVAVEERCPATTVSIRAGIASDKVGAVLGVDWRHPVDDDPEDVDVSEHRRRIVAAVALPFAPTTQSRFVVRLGAGLELAHRSECGFVPRHVCSSATHRGFLFEAAPAYLWRLGDVFVGPELVFAASSYSGKSVALALVAGFVR